MKAFWTSISVSGVVVVVFLHGDGHFILLPLAVMIVLMMIVACRRCRVQLN